MATEERPVYITKYAASGMGLHHGWHSGRWDGGEPAPGRRNFYHLVELVFALAAILMLKEVAAPLFFCYFAFAPLVNQARIGAWTRVSGDREQEAPVPATVERRRTQRRQS